MTEAPTPTPEQRVEEKPSTYRDAFLDLETLDTGPRAVILSVGIVKLDENFELWGVPFYRTLDVRQQLLAGRTVDKGTIQWWQDEERREARQAIEDETPTDVLQALLELSDWLKEGHPGKGKMALYGNGPEFDNVLLETLFDDFGVKLPWRYTENQSFRTIRHLTRHLFKESPVAGELYGHEGIIFEGIQHHALWDAHNEAKKYALAMKRGWLPNPHKS